MDRVISSQVDALEFLDGRTALSHENHMLVTLHAYGW